MRKKVNVVLVCNQAWTIYKSRNEILKEFINRRYLISVVSEDSSDADNHHCLIKRPNNKRIMDGFIATYNFYRYLDSNDNKQTVYILYSTKANLVYGCLLRLLGLKYICVVAGLGKLYGINSLVRFLLMQVYAFVARGAQGVQVLNSHDYDEFSKFTNKENLYRLHCEGFTINRLPEHKAKATNKIVMVSRLIREKGVFHYLNAVKMLRDLGVGEDYHFYLIGKYDITHFIDNRKIRSVALEAKVEVIEGAENIAEYFENADCFVFPSLYNEGMPRVLLEAAEHGAFIITSDYPGCRDFIDYGFIGKKVRTNAKCFEKRLADEMCAYIKLSLREKLDIKKHNIKLTPHIGDVNQVIKVYEEIFQKCI